ncbi:MAG: DUF2892 domain-containing protein [Neomegalonema sp.]|nr:DUF2892 domain-containing protein [Neomegalonema sp.]
MSANVGTIDRILRIVLGIVLIALPFVGGIELFTVDLYKYIAIAAGAVFLLTSLVRFCPLYRILGICTG